MNLGTYMHVHGMRQETSPDTTAVMETNIGVAIATLLDSSWKVCCIAANYWGRVGTNMNS